MTSRLSCFRSFKLSFCPLLVFLLSSVGSAFANAQQTEEQFITALLAKMTLEEKLGQLTQYTGHYAVTGPDVEQGGEEQITSGQVGSFLNIYGADAVLRLQHLAVEKSRLGIPLLFGHDVIHGFRTVFPTPLAESCSWNPALAERDAHIAAEEASAAGIQWTFAPMVDIARDARWGRIVEGAGEDTWLGAVFAKARVRGFQGADLRAPDSLMACAKHFAAYGGAEAGRDYNTVDISERTLWETYLPPFKAAVDAGVGSFMASFNEIGGVPSTSNKYLLTDVLRKRWHFDGLMVSDYTAILELIEHGVAATRADAGILALEAGMDMDMVSGIYIKHLPEAVKDGRLPIEFVDEAVRRVLRAKYRLGLFDNPYRQLSAVREKQNTLTDAHRAAAREAARESMVLLKNDGAVLPLAKNRAKLAVIGPLADNPAAMLGSWAAVGKPSEAVSIYAGVRNAVPQNTNVRYAKGCEVNSDDRSGFDEAVALAKDSDCIILALGEDESMSGEAASRASLDLPGVQNELAKAVLSAAAGKPVVVVLVNGRPLTIGELVTDARAPAILEAWQGGTEAGHAVADVLFGDYNPSGKLTVTFPRTVGQEPLYYNHKNTGRPPDENNKFTSKYLDVHWSPLYPFGYGLSYTTFAYSDLKLDKAELGANEGARVTVTVTNTGNRAGAEVAQLYIQDEVASVTRPVRELRGFQKIYLKQGEVKTISFTLTPDDLAFYNLDMHRVVEAGWFKVYVGTSSSDTTEARFRVTASYHMGE